MGRHPASVPRLVGRAREMAVLGEALAGQQSLVFVEGEAGIGKSRLVRELLGAAPASAGVLLAVCPPLRHPQTLAPLIDAVRRRVRSPDQLRLSALAGALRTLLPEWADALPGPLEPAEDTTAARHRVFRALAEVLESLGTGLLVVEDAHWADEATLEFLLFLRADPGQRISMVITGRPEDVPEDSLLRRLSVLRLAGRETIRVVLGPLDTAGTAELISSMLAGQVVSAEFARFLHERTGGVPLAIEESVRLLADRADVAVRGAELVRRDLDVIAVPASIRDAVLERAARLSPHALAVLRAAAVLGEPVSAPVLRAVTGLEPADQAAGLAESLDAGLITEHLRGQVMFRHVLLGQAIYDAIPTAVRRAMHLRAGECLENDGLAASAPVRLTRHFREAGEPVRWAVHAEHAADIAIAAGDAAGADRLLRDLMTACELPGSALVRLTRKISLTAASSAADWDALIDVLRSELSGGRSSRAEQAMLRFQLARILAAVDENDAARAELEAAVPFLPGGSVEAVWAMQKLAWPRGTTLPASEHLRWLRLAEEAELTAGPVDRLRLLVNRVTALLELGEESGWSAAARLPGEASSAEENHLIVVAAGNLGDGAMRWGRYEEARRHLTRALRMAAERGYQRQRHNVIVTLAHLDWFTGAWDGLAARAGQLAADADIQAGGRSEAALIHGQLLAAAGDTGRAREQLLDVLTRMRRQGTEHYLMEPAAALARLSLANADADGALRMTDEPVGIVVAKDIWIWAVEPVPVRVEALIVAGRSGDAEELTAAMARGLTGRTAPGPRAAVTGCQAMLAAARGEHARAAAMFARAADAWRAMPRPYDALLARERQASCLIAAGDRDSALALLDEVASGLARLGAAGDAGRVLRELRGHGVAARRPVTGRPSYGGTLSPRELEVVRLLTEGKTDKQIAEALVLSPRTVVSHLNSARRKLRAGSRTALAVAAINAGLAGGHLS